MPVRIDVADVPQSGTFIAAVSGGVDSSVLLELLKSQRRQLRIVVAHVEHGIRGSASQADARFVEQVARRSGYPFEIYYAGLGAAASEETARRRRYGFLQQVGEKYAADGIMTAHHQDDVLETICLNILRGTGWRGLCSLRSTPGLLRPLLGTPKADILAYARERRINWRHDSTNDSDDYTRNRVRRHIMPKLTAQHRQQLVLIWRAQCRLRQQIEEAAAAAYADAVIYDGRDWVELHRYFLSMVPSAVADELLRIAVLKIGGRSLLHPQLQQLRIFTSAARPGSRFSPGGDVIVRATRRGLVVERGGIC